MVDRAQEQIRAYTGLQGAVLDRKTLDICHRCRELVHEEQLAATRAALAARIEALRSPVPRSVGEGGEVKPLSPTPSSMPAQAGSAQLNPAANPWQPLAQSTMPPTPYFSGNYTPLPPIPSALAARLRFYDTQRATLKKDIDAIKDELRILHNIYDNEWDSIDSYESRTRGGPERERTLCRVYQAGERIKQLDQTVEQYTKTYVQLGQRKEEIHAEIAAQRGSAAAGRGASMSGPSSQPARGGPSSLQPRGGPRALPARGGPPRISQRGGTTYYY